MINQYGVETYFFIRKTYIYVYTLNMKIMYQYKSSHYEKKCSQLLAFIKTYLNNVKFENECKLMKKYFIFDH